MNHRLTNAIKAVAIAGIGAVVLVPALFVSQTPATATKTPALPPAVVKEGVAALKPVVPVDKPTAVPRTPDGKPDLSGYWTNATYTPLQRGNNVTKTMLTREEYDANARRAALQDEAQTTPGTTNDVHYDFTQFGLDKSQNDVIVDLRTSMITDPTDGKVPAQTPAAQQRARDRAAAVKVAGTLGDSVQTIVPSSRCIIYNPPPGPPMLPQGYNGDYQIIQSKDYLMIYFAQIGDVRVIPMDGRAAPPASITSWMGISRGHWDGDTLVVETTNFNERTEARNNIFTGISKNFKLIERFKRTSATNFQYEFTVNDPETFVKPWTASMPFTKIDGPIFEPACHEGNYGVMDTMKGYREQDKKNAAAAAGKKPGQ